MRIVSSLFKWALWGALTVPLAPLGRAEEALTPKQILDNMVHVYAGCKSYTDSGSVKAVFTSPSGNFTIERNFTTAFVRPDRFRFECREKNSSSRDSRYIVWLKGKEVQMWRDTPPAGVRKMDSLTTALAQTSGPSGGSASSIPALLFPDRVGGFRLSNLSELKRIEDTAFDGSICFRLFGRFSTESAMTLWIDNRTFLLRRIDSQRKSAQFNREQTTTYDPVLDSQVNDYLLEFSAPDSR